MTCLPWLVSVAGSDVCNPLLRCQQLLMAEAFPVGRARLCQCEFCTSGENCGLFATTKRELRQFGALLYTHTLDDIL
jgi:hypothetical protein